VCVLTFVTVKRVPWTPNEKWPFHLMMFCFAFVTVKRVWLGSNH